MCVVLGMDLGEGRGLTLNFFLFSNEGWDQRRLIRLQERKYMLWKGVSGFEREREESGTTI